MDGFLGSSFVDGVEKDIWAFLWREQGGVRVSVG